MAAYRLSKHSVLSFSSLNLNASGRLVRYLYVQGMDESDDDLSQDTIRVSISASERKSPFFELFSNHRGLFRFPPNFQYNVFQFHYLKSSTVLDQLM